MLATVPEICSVRVLLKAARASPCGRYWKMPAERCARASSSRERAVRTSGFRARACSTRLVSSASSKAVHQVSSAIAPGGAPAGAS